MAIEINFFRGAKRTELLSGFPLQYYPEPDTIRKQLIEYGRKFINLMGIHHRWYKGTAFYIDMEGEMVRRYVRFRVMVDTICFQRPTPTTLARASKRYGQGTRYWGRFVIL